MQKIRWFSTALGAAVLTLAPATTRALPTCGLDMEFLTHAPLDPDAVTGVTPLGGVSPQEHVLPLHVNYFYGPNEDTPVFAPGDVEITVIEWNDEGDGADDWHVTFAVCEEVRFSFHHLNSIDHPALAARAAEIKAGVGAWCDSDNAEDRTFCAGLVNTQVGAGDLLGTAIREGNLALNFIVKDSRVTNPVVTPSRYELLHSELPFPFDGIPSALYDEITPSRLHTRCVLDYYTSAQRELWEEKLGTQDGLIPSSNDPICGRMSPDLPGTAQGAWFEANADENAWFFDEGVGVVMTPSNVNPDIQVFSIGDTAVPMFPATAVTFVPFASGPVNLPFRAVTAIGRVHCWRNLSTYESGINPAVQPTAAFPGIILVRLDSGGGATFEYRASESQCNRATMSFGPGAVTLAR